ncbi:hypothetical protein B0H17DRAFT_1067684 [Mycena rosella]|uniref:Uncharacterized protein n=1 Tax=Mycena rosella TaxID=1033263 RepID=A0AAD7GFM4_MYCRO|nr:hypothetical protein B0H17DRAFT_1067684 [Mycena rosella]
MHHLIIYGIAVRTWLLQSPRSLFLAAHSLRVVRSPVRHPPINYQSGLTQAVAQEIYHAAESGVAVCVRRRDQDPKRVEIWLQHPLSVVSERRNAHHNRMLLERSRAGWIHVYLGRPRAPSPITHFAPSLGFPRNPAKTKTSFYQALSPTMLESRQEARQQFKHTKKLEAYIGSITDELPLHYVRTGLLRGVGGQSWTHRGR